MQTTIPLKLGPSVHSSPRPPGVATKLDSPENDRRFAILVHSFLLETLHACRKKVNRGQRG